METKICTKCKIEKPVNEYDKRKRNKSGIKASCKSCNKVLRNKWQKENKEKLKKKRKEWRDKNPEKMKKSNKKYRDENSEKIKETRELEENKEKRRIYNKEYEQINKVRISKRRKQYRKDNPEKGPKYYQENKERKKKQVSEYREENKEKLKKKRRTPKFREKKNKLTRDRRKNDIQYKLMCNIRTRLYAFLKYKNIQKNNTTILSVGCSKEHLTDWIKYNIDLDNLNEYHIDHVIPLASFNCKTYEEVIECKCNHWTNLMPTSPEYNLIKHDREPTKHELFKQELRIYLFKKSQEIKLII